MRWRRTFPGTASQRAGACGAAHHGAAAALEQRGIGRDHLPQEHPELLALNEAAERGRAARVQQDIGHVAPASCSTLPVCFSVNSGCVLPSHLTCLVTVFTLRVTCPSEWNQNLLEFLDHSSVHAVHNPNADIREICAPPPPPAALHERNGYPARHQTHGASPSDQSSDGADLPDSCFLKLSSRTSK
jgi:hypothetical protein